MKKVLLSLLAVAALVLSCQNYDDEFAALNAKVASLESQITSLSGLQTALTQVQSSVSALQAAVSAIPDLSSEVAAILADLESLASDVAGATTSADLDALKAELNTSLAALQALIEANSASIANLVLSNTELKEALGDLGVDVDSILAANATFEGNLTITNDAELAYAKSLGNKVATVKGDIYVKVDAFDHTSGGDGTGLTAAEVKSVLSQITYVVGNVKVDTDESLDLSSLASITGDYTVLGHDVSDDALISVGGDVLFDHDGAYISKIQTAGNIYLKGYVEAKATTSAVALVGTTSIDFTALTKASGVQTVSDSQVTAHSSGASLTFGAPENTKAIDVGKSTTSIKIGAAPVISVASGITAATTALTTVELHYVADKGAAADGLNPKGVDALASLRIVGAEISSAVVKAKQITGAVTVDVQAATATSNSASIDLSSLLSAGAITSDASSNDLSALETVGGITLTEQTTFSVPALTVSTGSISLSEATTFSAPKLTRVAADAKAATAPSDITADKVEGSVSLPALLKAGDISMDLVTSFSAPLAKVELLDIEEGVTTTAPTLIELGSISTWADPVAIGTLSDQGNVTTLKLHAQDKTFDLTAVVEATSIVYKGKAAVDGTAVVDATIDSNNNELVTLELGGVLQTVSVDTNSANYDTTKNTSSTTDLKTVITAGTIESLTVQNNFDLTTLTLGHTDDVKHGTAPVIIIKDNNNLTTFATSVKKISELTVTGNSKLSSFDLSSISELPNNWTTSYVFKINISGNEADPEGTGAGTMNTIYGVDALTAAATKDKLSSFSGLQGTYTAASANTSLAYGQSSIATLKPFLAAIDSKYFESDNTGVSGNTIASTSYVILEYRYDNTAAGASTPTSTTITPGGTATTGGAAAQGIEASDFDAYALFQ